jgi:hypothetical protein
LSTVPPKKKYFAQSLGSFVPVCLGDALAKQGFASGEIITRWDDIAGPELARFSEPVKMQWPPRGPSSDPSATRQPAVLHVRVEGAFALEFQIQAPVIIERINSFLGWRCIGQIRMKQGPVTRNFDTAPLAEIHLDAEMEQRIADTVAGIEEQHLHDALAKLGRAIAARKMQ